MTSSLCYFVTCENNLTSQNFCGFCLRHHGDTDDGPKLSIIFQMNLFSCYCIVFCANYLHDDTDDGPNS